MGHVATKNTGLLRAYQALKKEVAPHELSRRPTACEVAASPLCTLPAYWTMPLFCPFSVFGCFLDAQPPGVLEHEGMGKPGPPPRKKKEIKIQ